MSDSATDISNKPSSKYAWVTLVMKGDSYIPGALTTGYSLKYNRDKYELNNKNNNDFNYIDIVCMVTNDVSIIARNRLLTVFDHVIEVPYIQYKCQNLRTLKQQNLYDSWVEVSFTKWNCLSFIQYEKVCFIDADKIVLTNIDEIFSFPTPAGTFSSPWSEPFIAYSANKHQKGNGLPNPYAELQHGDIVPFSSIDKGLLNSFVVIGTMVLLKPDMKDFEDFQKFLEAKAPFGTKSFSMMDEQSITMFYHNRKINWTFIHQRYNYIPWQRHWLTDVDAPKVFHYFGKKVWSLPRDNRWPDVEVWWQIVTSMLNASKDPAFVAGAFEKDLLSISYKIPHSDDEVSENLNTAIKPESIIKACCWCQSTGLEEISWKSHSFLDENCNVVCPLLLGNNAFLTKFDFNSRNSTNGRELYTHKNLKSSKVDYNSRNSASGRDSFAQTKNLNYNKNRSRSPVRNRSRSPRRDHNRSRSPIRYRN